MLKKPTLKEYKKIGAEFIRLNHALVELSTKVSNSCGKKYSMDRCIHGFDKVRSDLDDRVFKQYPELDTHTLCHIFYGGVDAEGYFLGYDRGMCNSCANLEFSEELSRAGSPLHARCVKGHEITEALDSRQCRDYIQINFDYEKDVRKAGVLAGDQRAR